VPENPAPPPPPPWTEEERLKAVEAYQILDTPREEDYDDIVRLASEICGMPVSLVTIVADNRQWFKAELGVGLRETSLDVSICKHTIHHPGLFIVPDTTLDPRFADNPDVTGGPRYRFYAGARLETPDGLPIGTLCVLDYKARQLTGKEALTLTTLARQVMIRLELRRALKAHAESEERLRASEGRFRFLVESNVQGVLFWNRDGAVTDANDAFLSMVGYTREDLQAGRIDWRAMTPPEFALRDRLALEDLAARGRVAPYEKQFIRKDGSRVPILLGGAVFPGRPEEGACFLLDLTERKKLDQQFLRVQRMESIGALAGGIAHDLNNVLAPIMLSIDILESLSDSPEAKEIISTIETSARHGAEIVRQVLSFARGQEGRRIEIQLKHLLQETENILRGTFPRNIHAQFLVPTNAWPILGDPTQIHQMIVNLCVNARDAMPEGGTLTVEVKNCTFDDRTAEAHPPTKPGPYLQLKIGDTGTGIPPELIDKIFEPFFTTKELGQGTGLGLATVLAIVKGHDGSINVESTPDRGTTFEIFLPALPMSSPETKTPSASTLARGSGELILVVDDEDPILTVTSRTLQAFGYKVLTALDGAGAIETYRARRDEIALVLTDMMMPVMDGAATIRALVEINPAVRIIASSGLNAAGAPNRPPLENVRHFLTKPYTREALLRMVRAVLDEG
jgi:PAS domain S-box-containing protein